MDAGSEPGAIGALRSGVLAATAAWPTGDVGEKAKAEWVRGADCTAVRGIMATVLWNVFAMRRQRWAGNKGDT